MRIVGGTYRGRKLNRVMKETTRETADMVKVAVFNMLENQCQGTILDLFAGAGSYGIEAISRGAERVYFIDKDPKAIQTIGSNLKLIKEEMKARIYLLSYEQFLKRLDETHFDLIFLDPPYQMNIYEDVILALEHHINLDGKVVCESKRDLKLPDEIGSLNKIKEKVYGIKKITIYQK
ncbi:MAG: 16S rRNA (guanine(966)-N(2))-methyltransferase RsmD [Acholeplasmataceae bacterium]|jgi:16S rRNA (guanine(966)-N(2))-methyltransferase RsmD|nr:16S rRNA (guanine(966)-N(2))-methyltransferase RsmD [Acholeplasmataceae bacterium]